MPNATPFDMVVQRHGRTVLRVCRATLSEHDADDAWSETFLAALRAWPELDPETNVEAWLVTVARRKAIDVIRRRGRGAVPIDELADRMSDEVDHASQVVRDLDLMERLAALPAKQRQAVAYHHLGGLTHAEVAAVLGGTEAAARRASADGVARLRHDMEGQK